MAFDPRSDVVLEVLNAADPARAAAATRRLDAIAAAPARDSASFTAALEGAAPAAALDAPANAANARARVSAAAARAPDKAARAKQEFEAMLLNSFVGEMMPKEASAFYGQGLSGDMWKSMLAEKVAGQIAKSGALGLDRKLFAAHGPLAHESHAGSASAVGAAAAQASANPLSLPATADLAAAAFPSTDRRRS